MDLSSAAHNLFYYDDSFFIGSFSPNLTNVLNTLRLRAIAYWPQFRQGKESGCD